MEKLVDTALHKGWSVGWEGDVTENGFNMSDGVAYFEDTTAGIDQVRLDNYKSESTERDHMLHIIGLAVDENGKSWFYLKNSWGTWRNTLNGLLYMNVNYFKLKTVILFVNKRGLPTELNAKLKVEN
jgi:bleomycin hydrolase